MNIRLKCNEDAWIMIYVSENCLTQFEFNLPILGVWVVVCDWNVSRNCQGSFWDGNQSLNRPRTLNSVFEFYGNFQVL